MRPNPDLAVSPEDADAVLATTQEGLARSTDGGKTFARVDDAPTLVFIDWADAERLVGVGRVPRPELKGFAEGRPTSWKCRG